MKSLEDYHFLKLGEETLENPYPFFRRLRAERPIYREPDYDTFLVSRYDDIEDVSKRTALFSSIAVTSGPFTPLPTPIDEIDAYRAREHDIEKLFHNDPPDHARYRSFVGVMFTPRRMKGLEEEIGAHVDGLIDSFIDDGKVEIIQHFCHVLPLLVVGNLLGVPSEDNARFKKLFEDAFSKMDGYFFGNPAAPRVEVPHYPVLGAYFTDELARRRLYPLPDIMTLLANSRFPDDSEVPLSELVRICVFLYSAGGDSNMPQILTNGLKLLAERPEIAARLRANPDLMDRFVEEVMRYDTSALGLFRLARTDTVVGGETVPKGSFLMLLYGSGNHDEQYFADPDEFLLDRPKRRILSFGSGVHTCAGAPLARLQAKVAFSRILTRMSDFAIDEAQKEFVHLPSCILRSVRRLDLTFSKKPTAVSGIR